MQSRGLTRQREASILQEKASKQATLKPPGPLHTRKTSVSLSLPNPKFLSLNLSLSRQVCFGWNPAVFEWLGFCNATFLLRYRLCYESGWGNLHQGRHHRCLPCTFQYVRSWPVCTKHRRYVQPHRTHPWRFSCTTDYICVPPLTILAYDLPKASFNRSREMVWVNRFPKYSVETTISFKLTDMSRDGAFSIVLLLALNMTPVSILHIFLLFLIQFYTLNNFATCDFLYLYKGVDLISF